MFSQEASSLPVKIFVVFNHGTLLGKLNRFFTGCYAYHAGFIVTETQTIYDMSLLFRRIDALGKYSDSKIIVFDLPEGVVVTESDLQAEIFADVETFCKGGILGSMYGYFDFLMFGFRWLYHLVGKPTRNFRGKICSEKINDILVKHGWNESPFNSEVPSPCDIARYFNITY